MAYSFAQLEGLWIQAGGSKKRAPVMAAIALAESRGNPLATGADGEQGLWQIDPHYWGSLATYDPLANAQGAVQIASSPLGLGNWSTWNNGDYKHYLHSAAPASAPTGTGQAPGTTTAAGRGSGGSSGSPGSPNPVGPAVSASAGQAAEAIADIGQTTSSGGHIDWLSAFEKSITTIDPLHAVPNAIFGLSLPFAKFAQALDWFFVPSHWIRIFAGIGGGVAVIGGVWQLAHSGQDRPAALPMGIALTGLGGVLLFVAFHNLDPSIKTPGELLADLQGKAQTGLSATTSPAQAVQAAGG